MGGEDAVTDLVYITGGRSHWHDNELRYSLRSMCKHLKNMGKVFIVGTCPEWLTGVVHIPAEDIGSEKKEPRLYRKVLLACNDERITPNFLLCYDDNFLLQPHDADNFPNYYDGTLAWYLQQLRGANRKGTHRRCTENTVNAIGLNAKLFDVHCPILVNKSKFVGGRWGGKRDGYLLKSMYANSAGVEGVACTDVKINHPDGTIEEYQTMITGRPWFSTGDNMNWAVLGELMGWLDPGLCMYEK